MADLEIRPRPSLRVVSRELFMLVWSVASVVGTLVAIALYADTTARVVLAVVAVWAAYAGWTWGRGMTRTLRILAVGAPSLRLDDLGVRVRYPLTLKDPAALAWVDCVAVVVSPVPGGGRAMTRYVQFVAAAEDRVEGRPLRGDPRPEQLGLSPLAAQLAWLELAAQRPGAEEVVEWLRVHRPRLTLVGVGAAAQSSDE